MAGPKVSLGPEKGVEREGPDWDPWSSKIQRTNPSKVRRKRETRKGIT